MATFKKGDRVEHELFGKGTIFGQDADGYYAVKLDNEAGHDCNYKFGDMEGRGYFIRGEQLKLITDYQTIHPKVGEKYRVLKDLNNQRYSILCGDMLFIELDSEDESSQRYKTNKGWLCNYYLTTEYLELVEEPEVTYGSVMRESLMATVDMTQMQWRDYPIIVTDEPIKKQSLINKTMNAFKKAMLDADTKTLIKAGYLDDESLDLTTNGREQLMFILFEANKKALVDAAKAEIKEQEAKK